MKKSGCLLIGEIIGLIIIIGIYIWFKYSPIWWSWLGLISFFILGYIIPDYLYLRFNK